MTLTAIITTCLKITAILLFTAMSLGIVCMCNLLVTMTIDILHEMQKTKSKEDDGP